MIWKTALLIVLVFVSGLACNQQEEQPEGVNSRNIYAHYQISGDEDKEEATVLLQYYHNGPNGKTVAFKEPGFVELDGDRLSADSTKMTGAFYELQKSSQKFAGRHIITFADENKQQVSVIFEYTPFSLLTSLPDIVKRDNLNLELEGLKDEDIVRVLLIDTSFSTPDINHLDTVRNGRLNISRTELKNVSSGPVTLMLFKEDEKELTHPQILGGKLAVTYSLRKEFELVD